MKIDNKILGLAAHVKASGHVLQYWHMILILYEILVLMLFVK